MTGIATTRGRLMRRSNRHGYSLLLIVGRLSTRPMLLVLLRRSVLVLLVSPYDDVVLGGNLAEAGSCVRGGPAGGPSGPRSAESGVDAAE